MSIQPEETATVRPFTGWHFLAIMVAFYGVIIGVNVTMAMLASSSWSGLIVKNSYVASQHFNEQLTAASEQRARGWTSSLNYQNGSIVVEIKDRNGEAVIMDDFMVKAGRPVVETEDREAQLVHAGGGLYQAELPLGSGAWDLRIEGMKGSAAFRRDMRVMVNDNGDLVR